MGIGRILGAAAPIAAGYFAPSTMFGGALGATGSAIATGALTGAGIAPGGHDAAAAKKDPDAKKMAVKCDMCKDISGGPSCVRACPTGAAIRVNPGEFMSVTNLENY